jgi:hypothetical protein
VSDDEPVWMSSDVIIACADLVGRAGAQGFEIGYVHDDVPVEEAGWYAQASYQGARLIAQDHRSPTGAALALSERLLRGARCKCGLAVSLDDARSKCCRWRLVGKRWEPGCQAPALRYDGPRGDIDAMQRAIADHPSSRSRRSRRHRRGG